MEEILIFADDHHLTLGSELPDFTVGGLSKPDVMDMLALNTLSGQKARQCSRKLTVDEDSHEI